MYSQNLSINIKGKLLDFSKVRVMGILNVTPDSFYDGGKYTEEDRLKSRINQLIEEGSDIIDVGGMSSRPGAEIINEKKEWDRLKSALSAIREISEEIPVSVDTFRSEIAQKSHEQFNAGIINDISAGEMDPEMYDFIAEKQLPYIIMHMKGKPENMQKNPVYEDVLGEILDYFKEKVFILREKGVHDIIIDPGFGFGKTMDNNYEILNYLSRFKIFEAPLLSGISRKSMITNYLGIKTEDSLSATNVLHSLALLKGTNILRVHDVKPAKHTIELVNKTLSMFNKDW